jgi:hypothetical protein
VTINLLVKALDAADREAYSPRLITVRTGCEAAGGASQPESATGTEINKMSPSGFSIFFHHQI